MVAGGISLVGLLHVVTSYDWGAKPIETTSLEYSAESLGHLFMTEYLLPFEISSVLLLVALVGAAVIARRKGLSTQPD